jgi:spermidine synthase
MSQDQVPHVQEGAFSRFCVYVGEGENVSAAVTKSSDGTLYFHGAGKVQASTYPQDMRLQRMLGHITALTCKDPQDVLVVACGAGVTAGAFVPYPEVKHITICDIERLVPTEVTPMFGKENHYVVGGLGKEHPQDTNRVKVVYDDGRHFVRTTNQKFDIITSDPIDPWVKGCAALNTVEYYQMCRDHLKPGGVMALWIPLYENSQDSANSVLTTFFQVFPKGILWSNDFSGAGYDAVLYGQVGADPKDPKQDGTHINVDEMQSFINNHAEIQACGASVFSSLQSVGFGGGRTMFDLTTAPSNGAAIDLLSTYAGQAPDLKAWMNKDLINSDDNLRLQYLAGWALNQQIGSQILGKILEHYRFPDEIFTGSPESIAALRQALRDQARPEK